MPRKTHPDRPAHRDRGYLRQQRSRIIKKNILRSKREIHPSAVVVNAQQDSEALEAVGATTENGPVVALHPDQIRRSSADSKVKTLWPFNKPLGMYAGHVFNRADAGHQPESPTTKPGWRSKDKKRWRKEVNLDLADE